MQAKTYSRGYQKLRTAKCRVEKIYYAAQNGVSSAELVKPAYFISGNTPLAMISTCNMTKTTEFLNIIYIGSSKYQQGEKCTLKCDISTFRSTVVYCLHVLLIYSNICRKIPISKHDDS